MTQARRLRETITTPQGSSSLRVEGGVIFGVRCLGPVSKNTYGQPGVEATEYSSQAHDDARRLYEGRTCFVNHDRTRQGRDARDTFGTFRNLRTVVGSDGPSTHGDLHYFESHPLAPLVVEDVKRGLGQFGLSHDAYATSERIDRSRKRLVIEGIAKVNSIDLVVGAATNRNLWESDEDVPVTVNKLPLRKLLEGHVARRPKHPNRAKLVKRLIEMDDMAVPMAAEVDAPDADPDEAIDEAFAEATRIIVAGDGTADEKLAKIRALLDAQEQIAGDGDAADPDDEPDDDTEAGDDAKQEQAKPDVVKAYKASLKLLEQAGVPATTELMETLTALPTDKARQSVIKLAQGAAKQAGAGQSGKPGSGGPRSAPAGAGRQVTEAEIPTDPAKLATFLKSR